MGVNCLDGFQWTDVEIDTWLLQRLGEKYKDFNKDFVRDLTNEANKRILAKVTTMVE